MYSRDLLARGNYDLISRYRVYKCFGQRFISRVYKQIYKRLDRRAKRTLQNVTLRSDTRPKIFNVSNHSKGKWFFSAAFFFFARRTFGKGKAVSTCHHLSPSRYKKKEKKRNTPLGVGLGAATRRISRGMTHRRVSDDNARNARFTMISSWHSAEISGNKSRNGNGEGEGRSKMSLDRRCVRISDRDGSPSSVLERHRHLSVFSEPVPFARPPVISFLPREKRSAADVGVKRKKDQWGRESTKRA